MMKQGCLLQGQAQGTRGLYKGCHLEVDCWTSIWLGDQHLKCFGFETAMVGLSIDSINCYDMVQSASMLFRELI